MEQTNRDLAYYRGLAYTRRVRVESDEGGEYFVADVEELSGLESDGLTELEARYNLQLAFDDYITALLAQGTMISEPVVVRPIAVARERSIGRLITGLFRFGRTPAQQDTGVSSGSVIIDVPSEWSPVETEVETIGV